MKISSLPLFCLLLLCFSEPIFAQSESYKEQVDNLIALTNAHIDTSVYEAERTALEFLSLAVASGDSLNIFTAKVLLGAVYFKSGDYIKADKSYAQSAQLIKMNIAIDSMQLANYYQDLGTLRIKQQQYKDALENLILAYEIKDKLHVNDLGKLMSNISFLYNVEGQYQKSLEFLEKIYEYRKAKQDTLGTATILNNIAIVNNNLANYQRALACTEEALSLCVSDASYKLQARLHGTRSGIFVKTKQFSKAKESVQKKIDLSQQQGFKDLESTAYYEMANLLKEQGQLSAAEKYYLQSLSMAKAIGYNMLLKKLFFDLSNYYEQRRNYKKAMEYSMIYNNFNDSLKVAQNKTYISNLKSGFETKLAQKEKELLQKNLMLKEAEIAAYKTKQQLWIFTTILLLIISAISIVFYQYRNKTSQKLEALNAMKDKLFALVAHDLKNPLSAFRSITSTLQQNLEIISKEDIAHFIKRLNSSSEKLFELLQNLLEWALNETGKIPFKPVRMDMLEIVNDVDELLLLSSEEKQIDIINAIAPNTYAYGDKKMVQTIFRNILSNAIKFTPKQGSIKLSSTIQANHLHIHIKDSGIGISKADQQKLFSGNQDVNSIGNSKEKGTGLGLMLCKELLQRMQGKIWVESNLNEGSTFSFSLPLKS